VTIVGVIVLVLAVFLWIGFVANLTTMNRSDAAGNGLSYSFGVLAALVLWVLLAVLLVIANSRGAVPAAAQLGAFLLIPLSCWSAVKVIELLRDPARPRWLIAVPALIPPTLMAYAAWAFLPALHSKLSATTASIGAGALVLLLSVIWLPVSLTATPPKDATIPSA
jgi:hypothetical protein